MIDNCEQWLGIWVDRDPSWLSMGNTCGQTTTGTGLVTSHQQQSATNVFVGWLPSWPCGCDVFRCARAHLGNHVGRCKKEGKNQAIHLPTNQSSNTKVAVYQQSPASGGMAFLQRDAPLLMSFGWLFPIVTSGRILLQHKQIMVGWDGKSSNHQRLFSEAPTWI